MQVVGITNQQEVFVVSDKTPFKINQILVINDERQGLLRGEVVETSAYNRFIPLDINGDFVDKSVIASLKALGYSIDENTLYIAKVRLMVEAEYPIQVGSEVRVPKFDEVKDLLLKSKLESGLVLGVIKSSEELYDTMEDELKDRFLLYQDGKIINQNGVPFIFDIASMQQYPHIGIFGGSGSGKSFGLRVILEELMKKNIPTVVLDPHFEMNFRENQKDIDIKYQYDFIDRFECLEIGKAVGVKFDNLTNRDLINLIGAASAGTLTDSMTNVIEQVHKNKDTYFSFERRLSLLKEALEIGSEKKILDRKAKCDDDMDAGKFDEMIEVYREFGSLPPQSVNGVLWRLQRLYKDGIFTNDITRVEKCLKDGKIAVVQGPIKLLNVFSTYLISNIYHKRRDYRDSVQRGEKKDFFPPFIIAFDESHNFAPKGYDTPSKSIIKEIAQEGRKYGVFLILATQRPTLLDETVTAQLNTKLVFRTVRASDIATIKEETDITNEEAKRLPYLRSGDVFISSALFGRTVPVRIRLSHTTTSHTQNPFDELLSFRDKKYEEVYQEIEKFLPIYTTDLLNILTKVNRDKIKDIEDLKYYLDELSKRGFITKNSAFLGEYYDRK
ncbi:ATP-binding protein [Caloramator proteoclasticus]|uniref:Helicase HerA central domain-containing protein n=1 Tax=Caloramator proteoclasticus DSM 10124 TaxID=1121262 RepID=A0A1M4ZQM1_9CLOT|nr:ATP-binding protein [Caloramator proteoclasticus]SHF20363.1 hypothetical protein SAMN02746091_01985 [Caloramator proteoclasticus DSM 10124]